MALKFNPSFQTDDESVSSFIVRRYQFETIIDALANTAHSRADPPQFFVPAPRGSGKTTLCRRVVAETRLSSNLRDSWQAIFLGEESYTVTTPGEFFLECLFQLKDQVTSDQIARCHALAIDAQSDDDLIKLALRSLEEFSMSTGKRLLLIVENFHTILNDQIQNSKISEAKNLIQIIDDSPFIGILATSVTQAADERDTMLPQHYHRIELPPLSLVECRELWESLTGTEVSEEKLRPLQILTGGSPRLLHILAEFTRTPSLNDLLSNLNYLIDQNTEYFKSQLDALPAIERKVFVTLLEMWDPGTARQIAKAARVSTNSASAMLSRLTDRGLVTKESIQSPPAIYVAAERLFNIYYLMRRHNHPSSRVRALVSFMMFYYDSEELIDTTASLVREACRYEPTRRDDYHSTFYEILSSSTVDVRQKIIGLTSPDFIQSFQDHYDASQELTRHFRSGEEEDEESLGIQSILGGIEVELQEGDFDAAYALAIEAIRIDDRDVELWMRLSLLELWRGNVAEAISAGERARELAPGEPWSHSILGHILSEAQRAGEAEQCYQTAIEINPAHPLALLRLASIKEQRGQVTSALALFEEASRSRELTDLTRFSYGQTLIRANRNCEAEAVLSQGSEDFDNDLCRHALVELLEADRRQDDGIRLLQSVAESTDRWEAWADFGRYLLSRSEHFSLARDALRNAIDKGSDQLSLYDQLAWAIERGGEDKAATVAVALELVERFPDRADAWIIAGEIHERLGEDTEAETAYREALNREDGILALPSLTKLLQRQDVRRRDIEELLHFTVKSTEGPRKCIPARELAELAIHRGEDTRAIQAIEMGLQANKQCICCIALRGDIYRRQGLTSFAEQQYRMALDIDEDMIPALTGLAQLAATDEATELIERAIRKEPKDPRVLLARARLSSSDSDARLHYARAALELDSSFVEARLVLAALEADRGNISNAMEQLAAALTHLPRHRELIPNFVSAAMKTTQIDNGERLTHLLEDNENSVIVEPLSVAIRMLRGEEPMIAKEIKDVAWDIIVRS